jgi:hypothetical protein
MGLRHLPPLGLNRDSGRVAQGDAEVAVMSASVNVIEADHWRLPALSNDIKAAMAESKAHAQHAVSAAQRAGELLIQAKKLVLHGQWETWLAENCEVSARTAQAYMRLSLRLKELPPEKAQRVADLPLREALAAIASTREEKEPAQTRSHPRQQHRPHRNVRERAALTLKRTSDALRALSRNIKVNVIKRHEVESVRAKLQAALLELDALQAEQQATDVEVIAEAKESRPW